MFYFIAFIFYGVLIAAQAIQNNENVLNGFEILQNVNEKLDRLHASVRLNLLKLTELSENINNYNNNNNGIGYHENQKFKLKLKNENIVYEKAKMSRMAGERRSYESLNEHELICEFKKKEYFPTNCAEALGSSDPDGIYTLWSPTGNRSFNAFCMQDPDSNGKAWTVLQRRQDGSVDFYYRNWQNYRQGFGQLDGEFWFGLENIHEMTKTQKFELWIQMTNRGGAKRYAKYDNFYIGNEAESYQLHVGHFKGDASNQLAAHNEMKFVTIDRDDTHNPNGNMARAYHAGWWHLPESVQVLLNGEYQQQDGIIGVYWAGVAWSATYEHMAIRPVLDNSLPGN